MFNNAPPPVGQCMAYRNTLPTHTCSDLYADEAEPKLAVTTPR